LRYLTSQGGDLGHPISPVFIETQRFADTLRAGGRRIHETAIKRQDASEYIVSLPADRAKTIAAVRALVNKHIPRG
jgi:hypothetical protein